MPSALHAPALRRLSAVDAPLPGVLLSASTSLPVPEEQAQLTERPQFTEQLVWTDIGLWDDHPAWRADPAGHLLAPVDATSGPDGRGVLVPHCPLRLRTWLDGRGSVDDAAAVTVAVSILRGGAEADGVSATFGTWWVTSTGKPVLALGGTAPWREESGAMLADLTEGASPTLSAALGTAASVLADVRRLRREAGAAEDSLFAVAAPGPLEMSPVPQRPPSSVAPRPTDSFAEPAAASAIREAVRRHLDAEWADRLAGAWSRLAARRSAPSAPRRAHRRRATVVAAGAGIAVLAVGLLLPDQPRSAAGGHERMSATATPAVLSRTTPTPEDTALPPFTSDDLRAVGQALVDRLAECADSGCPSSVVTSPGRDYAVGAATTPSIERTVTLLDDYGGGASLRVTSHDRDAYADQIVVIVRHADRWLVRDVYDVADQP